MREFVAADHQPCYGSSSSWGRAELGYNDFLLNPYGAGWHLDRERFDRMLLDAAAHRGVDVVTDRRLSECRSDGDGWTVALAGRAGDQHRMNAGFLVDATGRAAVVARRLGARAVAHDQLVLATAILTDGSAAARSRLTMLEAVADGWWYAAQLPGHRVAVAYASDPAQFRLAGSARWANWVRQLCQTSHIAPWLTGCGPPVSRLFVQSAPSFRLDRAAGPGWLAVGDAAATYDPLSAQGIYKALANGLAAAEAIWRGASLPHHDCVDYAAATVRDFRDYARNHEQLYATEQRFARSPFWVRRHAITAGSSPAHR